MAEVGQTQGQAVSNGTTPVLAAQQISRLVFWQGMVSHHQWPYIYELANTFGYEVTWVTLGSNEREMREKMGWPNLEDSRLNLVSKPSPTQIKELLRSKDQSSLHVFSGPTSDSQMREHFLAALKTRARIGIMSEPPMPNRIPTFVKSAGHNLFRIRYGSRISHVFAIGHMGINWYKSVGYSNKQIVPWAYFPPTPQLPERSLPNSEFQMIYIGALNSRKGPDVLIKSLAFLATKLRWKLTLIGEGHLQPECMEIAQKLGVASNIEFKRFMPYEEAMAQLAKSDLAVVPSRHDGWGAVVSEALLAGIPVVCTENCGAADLVRNPLHGSVVPANDPAALGKALLHRYTVGSIDGVFRNRLSEWAQSISGKAGAEHFHQLLTEESQTEALPQWAAS